MAAVEGFKGVALIVGGDSGNTAAKGCLQFFEDPSTGFTHVRGKITGLAPGLHGFHIRSFSDATNGCNPMWEIAPNLEECAPYLPC